MNIDIERLKNDREYWDKRDPTGGEATHYVPDGNKNPWVKNGYVFIESVKSWRKTRLTIYDMDGAFPRPAKQWSGDGLPPVGVECEVLMGSYWLHCEIIGRAEGKAWVRAIKTDEHWTIRSPQSFRPLKSEKDRVVEWALSQDCEPQEGMMSRADFCAKLYDLGALKMPEG